MVWSFKHRFADDEWVEKYMELKTCETCGGARLRKESLWFRVDAKNIAELSDLNLDKLANWFERY